MAAANHAKANEKKEKNFKYQKSHVIKMTSSSFNMSSKKKNNLNNKKNKNLGMIEIENPHLIILIMRVSIQRPMSHPCKTS
ncbi:hypothetical protein NI465_10070 [Acinetobacter lwoffii]|uniref:hypothetical protein n=1 Tax=Acinetobacter lwoffii TaxID=28090 RepID=UPI00209A6FC2|nr:hypothetical protein [Acinetobacter lwoffii]MCO8114516.1 hypothetical protein [Acinetobacter lwoffii]